MASVRLSQETMSYDVQYSIQNHALGVSIGKILSGSVVKIFPVEKW